MHRGLKNETEYPLEAQDGKKTVAIIDLGSNSVRMIIVRVLENGGTRLLYQVKHMVQLGQGAFITKTLQKEAIDRTMQVLVSFAEACKSYDVHTILAIATAAVRDADNGQDFMDAVLKKTGIEFTCISGEEEARLIYKGVSEALEKSSRTRFFLDIGGGSTEFVVGNSSTHKELDSVKIGCVRLANMFTLGKTNKISDKLYATMQNYVRSVADHAFGRMLAHSPEEMIASSGTAQNLALMAAYLEYGEKKPINAENILSYKGLVKIVKLLRSMSEEERKSVMGINPRRVDVLIPGAAILQTVMEELGFDSLRTSSYGLRDGILVEYLEKTNKNNYEGLSIQESSVLKLARACRFEEFHARHVARLTLNLFDSAKACGLHDIDKEFRNLLYYSALLHDIGIFISFSKHDAHGNYLVRHYSLLGFTEKEQEMMGSLVAAHRLKIGKGSQEFAEYDLQTKQKLEKMAVFLKLAEALEKSHGRHVDDAIFTKEKGNTCLLITHNSPCPLEQEKIEQGKKILKKLGMQNICIKWILNTN